VSRGEPCDRQRICRTNQLSADAESVNSPGRQFLRTFPRLFATFGRQSRPLHVPRESGQTGPQKPPFPRRSAPLLTENSPPLCLGVETTSLRLFGSRL
jgi:hypothetical protein